MIIAYTGMPGSGKSYALVKRAHDGLKAGKMVFSNFPIKGCYKITLDDLCNYAFPENSLVLIDEAGRWFSSREWKDLPPEVFDLFTMHRHMKTDLVIGVQSFARIDKSLREVIELAYWAENRGYLPFHRYKGYYDLEKLGSMRGDHHVQHIIWKRKKYRSLYDTFSMKSAFNGMPEVPKIRYSILPKPKYKIRLRYYKMKISKVKRKLVKQKPIQQQKTTKRYIKNEKLLINKCSICTSHFLNRELHLSAYDGQLYCIDCYPDTFKRKRGQKK